MFARDGRVVIVRAGAARGARGADCLLHTHPTPVAVLSVVHSLIRIAAHAGHSSFPPPPFAHREPKIPLTGVPYARRRGRKKKGKKPMTDASEAYREDLRRRIRTLSFGLTVLPFEEHSGLERLLSLRIVALVDVCPTVRYISGNRDPTGVMCIF